MLPPPLSVLWLSSLCCPPSPFVLQLFSCGCPLFVAPLLCLPAVLLCCPPSLSSGCSLMLPQPPLCSVAVLSMLPPSVFFMFSPPSVLHVHGCSLLLPLSSGCSLMLPPFSVLWLSSLCYPLCYMAVSLDITICPPPSRLMPALPPVPIAIGGCLVNLVNLQYMI